MRVFLSHSTKDKDFVQQLAAAIIGAGSETWLCEVDVGTYENFVSRIEQGLKWCDIALLIWSPDAAASHWVEEEWTSVLARQVAEQKTRLGTVLLRDHPLPELLRTKNYIDARANWQAGFRQAVAWVEHRESVKRFLGLPEYRPQGFVGRAVYLQQLRTTFSGEPMVFLLHGEPGAGKSTLALQFAWDAQKDFDAVIYQTCGQRSIDAITASLVERLPIDAKTLPPDKQRDAAKNWLRQRESLLILDDVWPSDGKFDIRGLEPGPGCSVLYTSRQLSLPGLVPKQISKVERFTDAEAEELFHTYLDPVFSKADVDKSRQQLLDFAARVEMLPIAVTVGASLLSNRKARGLGKAILKLELDKLTDGARDVNELFRTAIRVQPPREQELLAACAVCVQEGFWLPLAAQIAGLAEGDADDTADVLVQGSLLRVLDANRRRFQLHALLREELRERAGRGSLAQLQERHALSLRGLFEDRESYWQGCVECLEEIIEGARFVAETGDDSTARQLSSWGYDVAETVGELDVAIRIMRDREDVCLRYGNKDGLGISYGNQALILWEWGQLDQAMALHKKEEGIYLETGNMDGLQASYGNQALILKDQGQLNEAMKLHKKEEAICRELDNKRDLAICFGNQAQILTIWQRLHEAMALHEEEEAICLEIGYRVGLQNSYEGQAEILRLWGRFDEALALLKKQEAICLEFSDRSSLGYCYWEWGLVARGQGDRVTETLKLLKALEIFTELRLHRPRTEVMAEIEMTKPTDGNNQS